MSRENVELMRGLYEAFGRGDVETVLGSMDEGIEWHEAENFLYADRSPYVGPQAVLEGVFARLGEDWEFFEVKAGRVARRRGPRRGAGDCETGR